MTTRETLLMVVCLIAAAGMLTWLISGVVLRIAPRVSRVFVIVNALLLAGVLLNLGRGPEPDYWTWHLADLLILGGLLLIGPGVRLALRQPAIWQRTAAIALAVLGIYAVLPAEVASIPSLAMVFSGTSGLCCLLIAWDLHQGTARRFPAAVWWALAWPFWVGALLMLVRLWVIPPEAAPTSTVMARVEHPGFAWFYVALVLAINICLFAVVLTRLVLRIRHVADHDPLTRAVNVRRFRQMLALEEAKAQRHGGAFALIALDLDHFKQVNDRFGHPAGDRVLRHVVNLVRGQIREGDVIARTGGEEFMILCPGCTLVQSLQLGERIRAVVAATPLAQRQGEGAPLSVTVSVGCASSDTSAPETLLDRADQALYQSKREGRNRVSGFEEP